MCMTGEPALEPPSYYFTKPAMTPADPCQPPPDGAQRFSRRVRGIAAQTDANNADSASEKLKTDPVKSAAATHTPYRMVTKRIRFSRRATLPKSVSPWCRSTRRRYRKVIVYVDENGQELSALDMHKRAKAGTVLAAAESETNSENAGTANVTKKAKTLLSPGSATRSRRSSMIAERVIAASSSAVQVCGQVIQMLLSQLCVRVCINAYKMCINILQCLDTVVLGEGRDIRPVKKLEFDMWMVVIWLELCVLEVLRHLMLQQSSG